MPTIAEGGLPGYESTAWYGLLAPAAAPKQIIVQLNTLIVKGGQAKDLSESFAKQGLDPQTYTPVQFGDYIKSEIAKNVDLVKRANIKPE